MNIFECKFSQKNKYILYILCISKGKKSTQVGLEPTTYRLEVCRATIAPLG